MQYIESYKSHQEIDGQELKNDMFITIHEMVVGYLARYEERLRAELGDDDLKEVESTTFSKYYSAIEPILDDPVVYGNEELQRSLNALIRDNFKNIAEHRLNSQKNTLKRNNAVLRFKISGGFEWYYLPGNTKPTEEHMSAVEAITSDYIADIDWVEEVNISEANIIELAESKIINKAQNLIKLMDSKTPWNNKLAGTKNFRLEDQIGHFMQSLDELIDLAIAVNSNLPGVFFEFLKADSRFYNYVKSVLENRVDEQLAQVNEAFIPPKLSKKEKKAMKAAEYALSKLSYIEDESDQAYSPISQKTESDVHNNLDQSRELSYVELGELEFDFPWFKNSVNLEATHITGGKQDVILVSALTPKLEKISRVVRDGLPKNASGEDKIDQTIRQIVKRIAGGIMPYEDTNSIKRLTVDKKDLHIDYQDETIWYSFDISPNSPRVYFTIRELHTDVVTSANNPTVQVVILAEADKARQIDTLVKLTSLDRTSLKARGAGSV